MRQVRVAPGYSGVPILGKRYNQGQTITLTDDQYEALPPYVVAQLTVIGTSPDPIDTSSMYTPPSSSYTDTLVAAVLVEQAVPATLTWDGSDYQPMGLKAMTDRPKTFIGPTDPHSVPGVVLSQRDQWINN